MTIINYLLGNSFLISANIETRSVFAQDFSVSRRVRGGLDTTPDQRRVPVKMAVSEIKLEVIGS